MQVRHSEVPEPVVEYDDPADRRPFTLDQSQPCLDDWDWVEIANQAQLEGAIDDVEE